MKTVKPISFPPLPTVGQSPDIPIMPDNDVHMPLDRPLQSYESNVENNQDSESPSLSGPDEQKQKSSLSDDLIKEILTSFSRNFVSRAEVYDISKEAIAPILRGVGDSCPSGRYAQLGPSGSMMFGPLDINNDMSYSDWAFGFEISGATVTVNAGKVRHGTRTAVTVAETPVEITADNTWIYVEYTYGGTAIITSSTTEPTDTEEVHKRVLYLVTLTGEDESAVASVGKGNIRHLGDIVIPGAFG